MTTGRRPTHVLRVKRRDSSDQGIVGVAWSNDNGSFSIRLNPCVMISSNDDVTILLARADERARPAPPGTRQPQAVRGRIAEPWDVDEDREDRLRDENDVRGDDGDIPFG